MSFFARLFGEPYCHQPMVIVPTPSEPTPRDVALALLYRELRDNAHAWMEVSNGQYTQLNKYGLSTNHDHLYNKELKISIMKHWSRPGDSMSINGKIKLTQDEFGALMKTWRDAKQAGSVQEIIEKLKAAHEARMKALAAPKSGSGVKAAKQKQPAKLKQAALPKPEETLQGTYYGKPVMSKKEWATITQEQYERENAHLMIYR
jgi:hypothetical protein